MSLNKEKIISFYRDCNEDNRATLSRAEGLEFHYTKKLLGKYIDCKSNVIEIGCATGYYGMYFAGICAHYTGVDLVQGNIDIFNQKIADADKTNIRTAVGDVTDLSLIPDCAFDVVLCLGPMYHLSRDERLKAFDECRRIAKNGAVLAFSYINRIGVYLGACMHDNLRNVFPNARASKNVFELNRDFLDTSSGDDNPGVFYYTSPEEMELDAKQKRLEVIENRGLDYFFAQCTINQMSEEQFGYYMEIADKMNESPSCTGLADHALLICKK